MTDKDIYYIYKSVEKEVQINPPKKIFPKKLIDHVSDKIPVWIYWHDGFDHLPPVVQVCINSIKENLPYDKVELILLDKNNLFNYIEIPEIVIKHIRTNYTSFSNIIRAYLLYAYGGMWIDSSFLLTKKIPVSIFYEDFWSVRTDYIKHDSEEPIRLFASNLMYARPGNELMLYIYQLYCSYWSNHDYLLVYDYIIGICVYGYDVKGYPRKYIDNLKKDHNSKIHYFTGTEILNQFYSDEEFSQITKDTYFLN